MGKSLRFFLLAASALVLGLGNAGLAQIISSSIVGQVTDQTGAAIPEVSLTALNEGTGISVKAVADATGTYSFPNLQPGTYSVEAQKAGLRSYRATSIQLLAEQAVRVDIKMAVGEMAQTINVTADTPLIKTETATVGLTVTGEVMNELPMALETIDALLALAPGAQGTASSPQAGGGTHFGSFNFTVDGTQANDPGNGAAAYSYNMGLVSQPPVSSLSEFKVEAYSTNAEYKNVGTVTMVTKGGTNAYHGTLYEMNQNAWLNANTFQNNANRQSRPAFVRNQFGGNVGGPIRKNKAFFFVNYSGMRNRTYGAVNFELPGVAMRTGDFSAQKSTQLYNPFSGAPFPNNQIPASMITKQAQVLNAYLPVPNMPTNPLGVSGGGNNYYALVVAPTEMNAINWRVDYHLSDTDQMYVTYNRNIGDPWAVNLGYPAAYGNGGNYGYRQNGASIVETHIFSPRIMNELHLSYYDPASIRSGKNLDFDPSKLFPQIPENPNRGLPTFTMSGYSGMFHDVGLGFYGHTFDLEGVDNLTYVRGRHTFKLGIDATTYKSYQPNPAAPLPTFSFSGQWTGNKGQPGQPSSQGNAYADFLLGVVNTVTAGNPNALGAVYYSWDWNFYAQDTWQVSSRLTFYYGLRYMYQTPWDWQANYSTYWDPKTNQLAIPENSATPTMPSFGASPALFKAYPFTTTQALGIPEHYMIPDKNDWGPRIGLAFRPFAGNHTVFRAGYGIYYNFLPAFAGSRDDVLNPPWLSSLSGFANSTYSTQLPAKPTTSFLPDITFSDPFPASLSSASGASLHPNIYTVQRDLKHARAQQWTATIEHQFSRSWAARTTYAGSQTHHISWFFGDYNVPVVQQPNTLQQNQRPFQPWATIYSTRSGASQNFEQLQLEGTKRFSGGSMLQAQYSWTRSLDNVENSGGPMIPTYPGLDYGNSTGVRRHSFVAHYVYQVPIGRGKRYFSTMGRWLDTAVGGWQISGITTYQSGTPFSVTFAVPNGYTGWWGGRASVVAGADLYANQGSGHNVVNGVMWFNPAAFVAPQPWTWGNSSRNMLWGPGMYNWDAAMAKTFSATERIKLQLRADFLNMLNHFNLSNPSAAIADTRDGGASSANSGKVLGGSGSRVVQVGARVTF
jgi:hypothetical protein